MLHQLLRQSPATIKVREGISDFESECCEYDRDAARSDYQLKNVCLLVGCISDVCAVANSPLKGRSMIFNPANGTIAAEQMASFDGGAARTTPRKNDPRHVTTTRRKEELCMRSIPCSNSFDDGLLVGKKRINLEILNI